ncbi:MAG TPA: transposase zinc-binding domain-containing protein [Terriglobales bacterium]|nr:transposase zinc-binding domain-containing protein [Terriglobales bacterium]
MERSRRWITWQHQKVLLAITRCRTAALGGHRHRCSDCGHTTAISYNSCGNRHCPRCQANARLRRLQPRQQELSHGLKVPDRLSGIRPQSVYDADSGEKIHDFARADDRIVIARGGRGGRGMCSLRPRRTRRRVNMKRGVPEKNATSAWN